MPPPIIMETLKDDLNEFRYKDYFFIGFLMIICRLFYIIYIQIKKYKMK